MEASARRLLVLVVAAAAAVLLCLSVPLGHAAPLGAEVAEFPGFKGKLPSKHYAGYDMSSMITLLASCAVCRLLWFREFLRLIPPFRESASAI